MDFLKWKANQKKINQGRLNYTLTGDLENSYWKNDCKIFKNIEPIFISDSSNQNQLKEAYEKSDIKCSNLSENDIQNYNSFIDTESYVIFMVNDVFDKNKKLFKYKKFESEIEFNTIDSFNELTRDKTTLKK